MRTFTVTIDEEKKKKLEEQQQYILKKLKDTDNQEKMVLVGYTIMLLYFCILIMRYALAFYGIQPKVLTNNPMLLILCSSLPIFLWLYMTKFDFFNYYRRKKFLAYFVMLNMLVTLLQPIYSLTWKYAVRYILKIPLSRTITINMVLGLARMVLAAALALATAIIVIQVQPYIFTPSATEELLYIKWKYLFDTRENHKYAYDLRFIKDLETGKDLLIKEIDRYTHMYITGASGTGKTSSCYNNIILQDLITKITNRNKRYKELAKMVLSGKAYFKKPFKIFVESYIEPKEEYKAEYDNIYKKYPDCGITVQAPNGSLNDGIIKMAAARKLTVNLIDPTRDKPKYKSEKLIGLNPFSIPLPEEGDPVLTDEVTVLILEKSKIFAQVLAALNELSGKVDTYFQAVNRSVTTTIATIHIHVLFGRCTTAEIDIYTKLAGTRREDVSQISKNWNSILSENPNISMSERKTPTDVNILTGRAARKRDFQEVTVFSQDEGRVLDAILGKVWFLDKKKAFRSVKTYEVDWEKLYLNSIKKNNNMQVNRNIASPSTSSTEAKTEYPETQEIQKSLSGSTADSHFVSLDRTEDAQDDDELLILPKQQSVSSLTKKQFEKLKEASQIAVESGQIVDRPDFAEFDDFFNN